MKFHTFTNFVVHVMYHRSTVVEHASSCSGQWAILRSHTTLGYWSHTTLGSWSHTTLGYWSHPTLGYWSHTTLGYWSHPTLGLLSFSRTDQCFFYGSKSFSRVRVFLRAKEFFLRVKEFFAYGSKFHDFFAVNIIYTDHILILNKSK